MCPSCSMDVTTKWHYTTTQTELALSFSIVQSPPSCSVVTVAGRSDIVQILKLLTNSHNFPSRSSAIFFLKFFLLPRGCFSLKLLAALPTTTTGGYCSIRRRAECAQKAVGVVANPAHPTPHIHVHFA